MLSLLLSLPQEIEGVVKGEDVTEFVNAINKLAETQHNQGEWSVNGAAFIVISVFVILILATVFGILIKSILNQQKQFTEKILNNNDAIAKFQESFDKNTDTLEKVSNSLSSINLLSEDKAKREITSDQAYVILKWALETAKRKIELDTDKIILANNIKDRQRVRDKIKSMVNNIHSGLVSGLNNFDINGNKVGDLVVSNDFLDKKQVLISDYIYSIDDNGGRNREKFNSDLDVLFETMSNKIKSKFVF